MTLTFLLLQYEVFCQFFIAYMDANGTYVDDWQKVARRYTLTPSFFFFDIMTSLPWSYLDFWAYQVRLFIWIQGSKCSR